MPINSKRKGKNGELEVVRYWRNWFPKAKRHLEYQSQEAEEGIDVILDELHAVQVKIGRKVPKVIYDFIEQIADRPGPLKFVQCRRNRKEWLVVLRARDFRRLLETLKMNRISNDHRASKN